MNLKTGFLSSALVLASASLVSAVPLTLGDFDGSESLIDFNNVPSVLDAPDQFVIGPLTITNDGGLYHFQGFAGAVLGTTGDAYNSSGAPGTHSVTLSFAFGLSRFGMNFGNSSTFGDITGVVAAFDANGVLVEDFAFQNLTNTFVGFDFATAVTRVEIQRDPNQSAGQFTFVDDVRYVQGDPSPIPLPAGMPLLLVGLGGLAALCRRAA